MDTLKKTPLYDTHVSLHGKMVDFGGWALPVQYTSIIDEHRAVRENVGLFDVSHMGEVMVEGKDAFSYIQGLVTNCIKSMTPGRVRYSPVCYDDGGTVDDILIYKLADEKYLLVINAGNTDKDYDWFCAHKFGDVKLENQSKDWAQLALQGPKFNDVLMAAGVEGELPTKNYTFANGTLVAGIPCLVSVTGYTGELGVELYCKAEDGARLHAKLMEAGKPFGLMPCGLGARDSLRFEAGMPLYGHELSKDISPLEAGLSFAVKLTKDSFIGKEALLKPIKRTRIGLKLLDKGILRDHYDVYVGDKLVGCTTSGMPVPTLDGSYAMALINIDDSDNENYTVEIRGRRLNAVKVDIPFYKRAK
ncbi:MAG: glycine cleavage system aminomethyltransferase GcvT [Eubacteriales bacterium]|nr:glycine cleavage system aminomethyltransferase GcvT [Clostridiales bacterium]MDY5732946.1 glycine cleavage system aminomethyltransferase GcvT [Eubacteriales bacterium]